MIFFLHFIFTCQYRDIVCLQPFKFDPNEKNKHKFMVQSIVCPKIDDLKKGIEIGDPNIVNIFL